MFSFNKFQLFENNMLTKILGPRCVISQYIYIYAVRLYIVVYVISQDEKDQSDVK